MARLSVNVNKVATLRNARGKNQPNLIEVVEKLISFGVTGITLHPRPDARHILYSDVRAIKQVLKKHSGVELNVEGYPSFKFLQLIQEVKPDQCTLVPDPPDVLTSQFGWEVQKNISILQSALNKLKKLGVRSSLFLDPKTLDKSEFKALSLLKPHRAELYTEGYALAFNTPQKKEITQVYAKSARELSAISVEVNAGHDLNLNNLKWFLNNVPDIKEVSIGHALICEALYRGLKPVVQKYLRICQTGYQPPKIKKVAKHIQKGQHCELLALSFFKKQGWSLRAKNQEIGGVEIDLLMEKPSAWLLVEVKSDNVYRRENPLGRVQKQRLLRAFSAFCEQSHKPVRVMLAIVDTQGKVYPFDLEF